MRPLGLEAGAGIGERVAAFQPVAVEVAGSRPFDQGARVAPRVGFEREVAADEKIKAQGRASAEQSLRALFVGLGFTEVEFVKDLPPVASRG